MPSPFDPIRRGAIGSPNRILMAPMTRARGTRDHVPTLMMAEYDAARASAGLIISEAIGISREGLGWPFATGLWMPEQIAGWRKVTDTVHAASGRIVAQLWHMGRTVHPSFLGGAQPVSASGTAAPGHAHTCSGRQPYEAGRPLRRDEIPRILDDVRAGARNAMAAGFDGVQIHASNGYLIDELLRDSANPRKDAYGGSIGNRIRLLREVAEAVADTVGRIARACAWRRTARRKACATAILSRSSQRRWRHSPPSGSHMWSCASRRSTAPSGSGTSRRSPPSSAPRSRGRSSSIRTSTANGLRARSRLESATPSRSGAHSSPTPTYRAACATVSSWTGMNPATWFTQGAEGYLALAAIT